MSDTAGQELAQHLHDYRVNRSRGQEKPIIPRTCIECGADARPRWLYCCDECARRSRQKTVAAAIAAKRRKR
jgi:hypothetical protein